MKHEIVAIKKFVIVGPYTLKIFFDDSTEKLINFLPMLKGEIYGPLVDESFFNTVQIDPEIKTLVWPNGADFDPSILHNWDAVKDELFSRAASWAN